MTLIATDRANHSIEDLRKEDVQVREGSQPRLVSFLEPDKRPIDYAIVIDNSASFRELLKPAIEAATRILNSNGPSDETFLERFVSSDKIERVQDFTSDKASLLKGLNSLYVEMGQSAVNDAVHVAVTHTAAHNAGLNNRRRAVVLFSDGEERNSFYSEEKLSKLLREKDVQVFVIGVVSKLSKDGGLRRASPRVKAEKLLELIARESGGRLFLCKDNQELLEAAAEVAHDLHFQYLIGFEPLAGSNDKKFHKVSVSSIASPNRGLKLITRPVYSTGVLAPLPKPQEQKSP
jgi:Ca-activated chloride channel family protein